MKTDRRTGKELTRMVEKMDYGLIGMKMERNPMKELSRMGITFL